MSSNEWLPAQIPFDLVRRGFAPDQVTAHLERLEYDLRIATANGDATNQRLSEVSAQLHNAQAEADELRGQLDNLAREPVSMTGLSNRMQRMIRLAEEEAAEIRARANAEADKVTGTAAAAAAATAAEREAFDGERERTRRQLADQVRDMLAEANSDAEAARRSAQEESQAALAAATAASERLLTDAAEESRSTLTAARQESTATLTAARDEATATLTSARAEAEHTLSSAREEAESLTAASTAERQRLDAEGNARRKAVDEDFEIAISSRRAEAHQRLAEREEISVADANNRITEATAESELRVQEATDHAAELIRRAAAESHQRVADADHAVQELTTLRSQVLDQLASLRDHLAKIDTLAASAPALLDPPDTESTRPVTADFPVDPGQRPTGLPASYNSEPGPWDDVTVESVRAERSREQGGSNGRNTNGHTDVELEALDADLSFDKSDVPSLSAQSQSEQSQSGQSQSEPAVSIPSGSNPSISAAMAESDTDTFARITDLDDGGQASAPPTADSASNTPMPAQHRTGLRAFADRAMGGR